VRSAVRLRARAPRPRRRPDHDSPVRRCRGRSRMRRSGKVVVPKEAIARSGSAAAGPRRSPRTGTPTNAASVGGHVGAHRLVDRAEVLADHRCALPGGLDGHHGAQLLVAVADVGAMPSVELAGNPVQAVESHDVVDAQRVGPAERVTQHGDDVAVLARPDADRVQRRESPVLARLEEGIGRGAPAQTTRRRTRAPTTGRSPTGAPRWACRDTGRRALGHAGGRELGGRTHWA